MKDTSRLDILFPDWQGYGESKASYAGALALANALADRFTFTSIPVPQTMPLTNQEGVLGLDENLSMLRSMRRLLEDKTPSSTFMIGGTCASEIGPVSYLNHKLNGDLCVLWFDAHGDLNTPASSPSGHLHGMPLRTLLGEGHPSVLAEAFSVLSPEQVILVGTRDLDRPEVAFIQQNAIQLFPPAQLTSHDALISAIESRNVRNVYLHLDLDILDPKSFPHLLVPTPGGLSPYSLTHLIHAITDRFNVAGFSVVEYVTHDTGDTAAVIKFIEACLQHD